MSTTQSVLTPPKYCKYSGGECDQIFSETSQSEAFFIYPSQPVHLANTIHDCIKLLQLHNAQHEWKSWEDLSVSGQIIFCQVCKAIRTSQLVVANITTLNFNVLFELGYCMGLQKPIIPIRDSTYESHIKLFDEIGIFDTLGYRQFTNSLDLTKLVKEKQIYSPSIPTNPELDSKQPIFYIRSPIDTDGSVKLFSCLKKSWFRFRTFDVRETPRLSLHDAYKHVLSSIAVVAHLIDPDRTGATVHNARAAFVCGMALAAKKHVLMLQEGRVTQPIDYRDIIIPYTDVKVIPYYIETILRETADTLQTIEATQIPLPKGLLEKIDIGDVAAENEIKSLSTYFVKTPQFQQVRQGHARIVIGRKGSGKTAMFYGIRGQFSPKGDKLILDLKPEGHQFTRLREMVLDNISEGLQLHTLTAFWHYLLLLEIAKKLIEREQHQAYQNPELLTEFNQLVELYEEHLEAEGDFSERLMALVNRIVDNFPKQEVHNITTSEITEIIYHTGILYLNKVLIEHLKNFDGIYILFDNIDKGFPTHGLQKPDVLIIRCLLEATRKLQVSLETHGVECLATIFIRKDVFDHLVDLTPDRGKESYVNLDWSDIELVKELLLRRFRYQASELKGSFEDVWSRLFEPHVNGENSFNYILAHTFWRPRDVLNIVRKCIQIAVSRGHDRVTQEDILAGQSQFSSDMLNELRYEIRDVFPEIPDVALAFYGADYVLTKDDVDLRLMNVGVTEDRLSVVKEIMLWFSFLGFHVGETESYSYQVSYDIARLEAMGKENQQSSSIYCIHPAFRAALTTLAK